MKNMQKRLLEIKSELKNLRASIATAKDEELDGIEENINALETEKATLEKRASMLAKAKRASLMDGGIDEGAEEDDDDEPAEPSVRSVVTKISESNKEDKELMQKRAAMGENWKRNNRTVILDNSVLIPKPQSSVLAGYPFNQVSTILDVVNYLPIPNGESYEQPYIKGTGEGDYTEQPNGDGTGGMYHEVDLEWDTVKVTKTKITAYAEVTKELEKVPAANYAGAVEGNITVSLKKKLAKEIVVGDGADGHFTGIMSSAVKADLVADYELGAINENTLDELILNYGGEEDIESKMAILVNKLTLLQFSKVRGNDKRKVYTIDYANGTIDGIKFYTSSHVKSFTTAGTGDAVLAYGDFNKYRVAVFSNIETARSTEYKFRQGITAFRGDVFMGGNVMAYKAFIRVFKGASSVTTLTPKAE